MCLRSLPLPGRPLTKGLLLAGGFAMGIGVFGSVANLRDVRHRRRLRALPGRRGAGLASRNSMLHASGSEPHHWGPEPSTPGSPCGRRAARRSKVRVRSSAIPARCSMHRTQGLARRGDRSAHRAPTLRAPGPKPEASGSKTGTCSTTPGGSSSRFSRVERGRWRSSFGARRSVPGGCGSLRRRATPRFPARPAHGRSSSGRSPSTARCRSPRSRPRR
jgi:hypothetical protein